MPKPTGLGIAREVSKFISAIDSLAMTVETAMDSLVPAHKDAHKEYDSYVQSYGEVTEKEGKKRVRMISHEHCHQFGVIERRLERIHAAQYVVPQSFLVALVSRYDALLGGLMRVLFRLRPEALKTSEGSSHPLSLLSSIRLMAHVSLSSRKRSRLYLESLTPNSSNGSRRNLIFNSERTSPLGRISSRSRSAGTCLSTRTVSSHLNI